MDVTPYFFAWSDKSRLAALMFERRSRHLIWANTTANDMLSLETTLRPDLRYFRVADDEVDQRLTEFVAQLDAAVELFLIPRPEGGYLVLRAEILAPTNQPEVVAAYVHLTVDLDRYIWADLSDLFGLTKSEVKVVRKLTLGDGPVEISSKLGITVETVRTHIRRIYAKLQITTREQLFAALDPFRVI